MHKFRKWVVALAAVVVWAVPARAADKEPADKEETMALEGAVRLVLARQESVQHDLKVPDKVGTRIDQFASRQWKKAQEVRQLPAKEREAKFDDMAKENERFLDEVLTPAQRKRLDQIAMQRLGLLWVTKPGIAAELKLTADQKKRAHELQQEARKEGQEVLRSSKGHEVKEEQLHQLRMDSRRRLMSLLTEDQKAKWKAMTGERFKGKLHFGPPKKEEKRP